MDIAPLTVAAGSPWFAHLRQVGETAGDVKPGTSAPASAFPHTTDNLGDNKPSTSPAEDKALLADTAHSDGVTPPKPNPSDGTSLLETFTPAEVRTATPPSLHFLRNIFVELLSARLTRPPTSWLRVSNHGNDLHAGA